MLRLEQIRLLENRIQKAVKYIEMLREENTTLKRSFESAQKRLAELESLVDQFKTDQDEIEQSILRAIKNLDRLEDQIGPGRAEATLDAGPQPAERAEAAPAPAAASEESLPGTGRSSSRARARLDEPEAAVEDAAESSPSRRAPAEEEGSLFDTPAAEEKKPELDIF